MTTLILGGFWDWNVRSILHWVLKLYIYTFLLSRWTKSKISKYSIKKKMKQMHVIFGAPVWLHRHHNCWAKALCVLLQFFPKLSQYSHWDHLMHKEPHMMWWLTLFEPEIDAVTLGFLASTHDCRFSFWLKYCKRIFKISSNISKVLSPQAL